MECVVFDVSLETSNFQKTEHQLVGFCGGDEYGFCVW